MGEAFEFEQLSRFFKPITKETEKIEKGVRGLPGEIAKVLPRPINLTQQMQPPPAYEAPYAGEAKIPEEEEKEEEDFNLPEEVEEIGEGIYQIGDEEFEIKHKEKQIETKNKKIISKKITNFLIDRKYNINWNDLNEYEKDFLGNLIVDSNILYEDPNDKNNIKPEKPGKNRWVNIYKPIWYNRFLYMDDVKLKTGFQQEQMKRSYQTPTIRKNMTPETKKLIKTYFPNLKGEGLKGSGLKKDYVTLPSDPVELVDRLTLLSGSKDAGNTGVYNEMASICDELLKRKIIGKGQYKQFLSNI